VAVFLLVVVILALLGVLGAVIEGLLWLTFAAALVIVAVVVYGWWKFRQRT